MIKECKRDARTRLKKMYVLFVMICLMAGVFGVSYHSSITELKGLVTDAEFFIPVNEHHADKVWDKVFSGKTSDAKTIAKKFLNEDKHLKNKQYGVVSVGHSKGVFASIVNNMDSGEYLITLYDGIFSITEAKEATLIIMILISMAVSILFEVFFKGIFRITYTRIFLECRIYDSIPTSKSTYLIRSRKWFKVAMGLLRSYIQKTLWCLTIIGGFIKPFSYMMVPYILAENPDVSGKEAITLSRKMMDGHKIEAFRLQLSFIGWFVLDILTCGLVGIFYYNPYREATMAQYYARIRQLAVDNGVEGAELLNDRYLFEYASDEVLKAAYSDGVELTQYANQALPENKGFRGFLENVFGLTYLYDDKEKAYEKAKINQTLGRGYLAILEHEMYPTRLFALESKAGSIEVGKNHYDRHYSIISIVMIFFAICIIGWTYEVSLHLIRDGVFVNRGVMHGPWLPIYGSGGVLIIVLLNKFRKNIAVQFVLATVLCGIVEYLSSWYLEIVTGGMKWWDYSGCFININGRVCAEGLLVFGLGGLVIVYFLAPMIDNVIRGIKLKVILPIAIILVILFGIDKVYSTKHPNEGKGITSDCVTQYEEIIM